MYNVKRNMYIEILIFFMIFIIYSFGLLRSALDNLKPTVDTYKNFAVTSLKEDLEKMLTKNSNILEFFEADSYFNVNSNQSLTENSDEIIQGLNTFSKLFDDENIYLVLINGEIYGSTYENTYDTMSSGFGDDVNELINSKDFISSIILDNKLNYKNDISYLYHKDNKSIMFFVHAVYDENNKLIGHLVKELNIHENLTFFKKAFKNFKIRKLEIKNLQNETLCKKESSTGKSILNLISNSNVDIKLDNFDLVLNLSLDYEVLYKKYFIAVIIVICFMFVLAGIVFYNCKIKDLKESYKKIILSILIISLIIGNVTRDAYQQNSLFLHEELVQSMYQTISYDVEKMYEDIEKSIEYVEGKTLNVYENFMKDDMTLKDYVYTTTRKLLRYVIPNTTSLCISDSGKLYYGYGYVEKNMTNEEKEDYNKFINSTKEQEVFNYPNLYGDIISRTLRKVIDKSGNLLITVGFDLKYVEYIKNHMLSKYTLKINEDIEFYEIYNSEKILKTVVKEKDKGVYYNLDNSYDSYDEILDMKDDSYIKQISLEEKNSGMIKYLENGKVVWKAYVKMPYGQEYIVINIDGLKMTSITERMIIYILFIVYLYALFLVFLYDSKILSTKNYKVKEYEIHSNY